MSDFIKSDYCGVCDGTGFIETDCVETGMLTTFTTEQCEECERLHKAEILSDLMHEIAKGN